MALTVEDGTGLSTAESYISEVDASAYLANFGGASTQWDGLAVADREVHLRKASRYVDAEYGGFGSGGSSWRGCRGTNEQALDWPRSSVITDDNFVIASSGADSIPQKLKDAVTVLADKSAQTDLIPDQDNPSEIKSESVKLGPIAIQTAYEPGAENEAYFRLAESMLGGLLESNYELRRA